MTSRSAVTEFIVHFEIYQEVKLKEENLFFLCD